MLFEIISTGTMLGVMGSSYYFQHSQSKDHEKIEKIAKSLNLKTPEESIRLFRKRKGENYIEYVYKIPLGLSFKEFEDKKQVFVDGLNNKSRPDLNIENLKKMDWKGNVPKQIKNLINNRKPLDKQIEMEYDGMLKMRVYEEGLPKRVAYDDDMLASLKGWQVPIGITYKDFITHDFDELQMLVVAGMTRYGKTVFLKNAITTLIHQQPNNVRFTLIDLKGGLAFSRFINRKQVDQVAKDEKTSLKALESLHKKILDRQEEFLEKGYEDIGEAGYKKRHFVVIDEGAEVDGFKDKQTKERCTHLIGEIARLGAGLGYRLIFATQYPTADVFPRQVKANTSAALCFKLKNSTQSMVVLDRVGAEQLPTKLRGRAIYQTDTEHVLQTPYITNDFINDKLEPHRRRKENAPHQEKATGTRGEDTAIFEEA